MSENANLSSFVLRVYFSASFLCIDPQILIDFKACRNLSNLNFKHSVVVVDKDLELGLLVKKLGAWELSLLKVNLCLLWNQAD